MAFINKSIIGYGFVARINNIIKSGVDTDQICVARGELNELAVKFRDDDNLGLYSPEENALVFVSGGGECCEINNSNIIHYTPARINYQSGNPQLELQRGDGNYNAEFSVDSSNNVCYRNRSGSAYHIMEFESGGGVIVRPLNATVTNADFCVQVGDGVSAYNDLIQTDQTKMSVTVPLRAADGLASAPAYSFTADSDTGMYRASAGALRLAHSGNDKIIITNAQIRANDMFRISYQSGNTQQSFADSGGNYVHEIFVGNDDTWHFQNNDGTSTYLENSTGGEIVVRPTDNTVTDVRFNVAVGNGSSYDDIFTVDENRGIVNLPFNLQEYTVATLPSGVSGDCIMVTDEVGGYTPAFYDGVNWRRTSDRAIVS